MATDEDYMRLALLEAEKAYELEEVPIGAVLVDECGQVVASGHNMREIWHDATAHAELIAIQEACRKLGRWRLSGLTLYVTIEPCPMCAGAIVMSRVDRVVYGSTDAKAGACESVFNIPGNGTLNHPTEQDLLALSTRRQTVAADFSAMLDTHAEQQVLHRFHRASPPHSVCPMRAL